jgi:hypothetical protein
MTNLVTVYDSAGGEWPLEGQGKGAFLLTYVDGWGGSFNGVNYSSNFQWAKAKFPAAWCIQITKGPITFHTGVPVIDCEPECATAQLACGWANREIIGKRYPVIYCDQETEGYSMDDVLKEMKDHYTDRVLMEDYGIWLAAPGLFPTIPKGCVAVQNTVGPGIEWEESLVLPSAPFFKHLDPAP